MVGNPGHPVRVEGRRPEGPDADWVHLPDPIADALKQMATRVAALEREIAVLRGEEPRRSGRGRSAAARAWSEPRGRVAWGFVPSFSHSVELSQPPEAVFPWLLEEDKVPQLDGRPPELLPSTARSARRAVRQTLDVAGGLTLTMEITRYDPPRSAPRRASRPTASRSRAPTGSSRPARARG